jgi:hypothetical protein
VVGGGFAGVAAAIASARNGAKTLIVEKGNCFGGAATNSLVTPFMPVETKLDGERISLAQGLFSEIHEKLIDKEKIGKPHWNKYNFCEEKLKFILNDMLLDAGAEILFHAYLSDATVSNGKVDKITVITRGGKVELTADYFIDATGDAFLSFLSGAKTRLGREQDNLCQPMTLCFRVANVDRDAFYANFDGMTEKYIQLKKDGKIKNRYEKLLVFNHPIDHILHFNSTRVVMKNPVDAFEYSAAEIEAREYVKEVFGFLKEYAWGMENAYLLATGSEIGVRESRMIDGEYLLTGQDLVNCTKFSDAIAACNYDIDIHNPEGEGTSHYYFADGKYYTIPYRSLIPKGFDNLLVAGRCISSDHEAQASYRIMPTVCCIGQAAGTAVALAVKSGSTVKDIDIKKLQKALKDQGAFIGV